MKMQAECPICKKMFTKNVHNHIFCSSKCWNVFNRPKKKIQDRRKNIYIKTYRKDFLKEKLRKRHLKYREQRNAYFRKYYQEVKKGTEKERLARNRRVETYNLRHPDRKKAHEIFGKALRSKEIIRPNKCSVCKKECIPEGHHPDYSKPLKVIWFCKSCHELSHHG